MERLLEVKEFDRICCDSSFKSEYKLLPVEEFNELEEFIHAYAGDEENADALNFLRIGYQRNVGRFISVSNYVGLIQLKSGIQIQVLPKIDFGNDPKQGNEETKRVFLQMLRSMKDFPSKAFNEANLNMDQMPLYEIFISMYLQEVRTLVKHGIKSAYVRQEDNLSVFKGKLIVKEHIKKNLVHRERFFVAYDEYLVDRPENRIIKATLLKLQKLSSSAKNQKEIRMLLTAFELVSASTNYQSDFSKAVIDRSTQDYEMLLRWSRVFLLNKSFTSFSGDTKARALLFPMEKVFEAYVAQQLKKAVADANLNWTVSTQDERYYLFDTPKQFGLRPDIVISWENNPQIILDTKWKSLTDKPGENYGISQADMYQMYAYAKKYQTSEVWLLYPQNAEMGNHKDKEEIAFHSDDGVNVRLFFVDLAHIEESLALLLNILQ